MTRILITATVLLHCLSCLCAEEADPKMILELIRNAEIQFCAGGYNDADINGVGENGTIAQLCGLEKCWDGFTRPSCFSESTTKWAQKKSEPSELVGGNLSTIVYGKYIIISLTRVVFAESFSGFWSAIDGLESSPFHAENEAKVIWLKGVYPLVKNDIIYDRYHYIVLIVKKSDVDAVAENVTLTNEGKNTFSGWVGDETKNVRQIAVPASSFLSPSATQIFLRQFSP